MDDHAAQDALRWVRNEAHYGVQLTSAIKWEGSVYAATCPELGVVTRADTVNEVHHLLCEAVDSWLKAASQTEIDERVESRAEMDVIADRIWGRGGWVTCPQCLDSFGRPARHSAAKHEGR